jgi:hypothetical protein
MAENKRIRVWVEDTPLNPRHDWDNLCTMVCEHKRYDLGDKVKFSPENASDWRDHMGEYFADKAGVEIDFGSYDESIDKVFEWIEENVIYLNLYLYDHSGITISGGPFSCRWDSGQVGFIYCTLGEARNNWGLPEGCTFQSTIKDWYGPNEGQPISLKDAVKRTLNGEVETYDQYLRGDIYGFTIEEWCPEIGVGWEAIDSCGGFFGTDFMENGMADHIDKELHHLLENIEIEY